MYQPRSLVPSPHSDCATDRTSRSEIEKRLHANAVEGLVHLKRTGMDLSSREPFVSSSRFTQVSLSVE